MPTLAVVQADADAMLSTIAPNIVAREDVYRAGNPLYFQGIVTTPFASIPNNTNAAPTTLTFAPNMTQRPTDQAATWQAAGFSFPALMPIAVEITTYRGRRGIGYNANFYFMHGGRLYVRNIEAHDTGSGGEPERGQPWHAIAPPV